MKITIEIPDSADRAALEAVAKALLRAARGHERTANAGWGKGVRAFARSIGVSHQRVSAVLSGQTTSRRISKAWGEWQARGGRQA